MFKYKDNLLYDSAGKIYAMRSDGSQLQHDHLLHQLTLVEYNYDQKKIRISGYFCATYHSATILATAQDHGRWRQGDREWGHYVMSPAGCVLTHLAKTQKELQIMQSDFALFNNNVFEYSMTWYNNQMLKSALCTLEGLFNQPYKSLDWQFEPIIEGCDTLELLQFCDNREVSFEKMLYNLKR